MPSNIEQSLRAAVQLHQSGRLAEAEQAYRKILAQHPNHPNAMQLLGVLASDVGRHEAAIELISRAISIVPGIADWHTNLGSALRGAGKTEEAIAAFQKAI